MLPNDWPAEIWFGDIWLQAGASQSFMPRYPGVVRYPTSNAKGKERWGGGEARRSCHAPPSNSPGALFYFI